MISDVFAWIGLLAVWLIWGAIVRVHNLIKIRRLSRRDARGRFVARRPRDRAPSFTLLLVYGAWLVVRYLVTGVVRLLSAIGREAYWTVAELWWSWQAWCEAPLLRDNALRKRADAEHLRELTKARLAELEKTA